MGLNSSASSEGLRTQYANPRALPPWEVRSVAQVPYMQPGSPPPSASEQQAVPKLRATCTSGASSLQPKLNTTTSNGGSEYGSPTSPENTKNLRKAPTSISSPPWQPAPYETPVYIPPTAKTAPPQLPPFVIRAPPTPPESLTRSCSSSRTTRSSARMKGPANAMPGTMSSRAGQDTRPSRSRVRSASRDQRLRNTKKHAPIPFGQRFKSAFKDMFKRDPLDESQFERIEDRHWTDEY